MKGCAILLLLVICESFARNVTLSDIRKLWLQKVAPHQSVCMQETGLKQEVIDEYKKNLKMPNDHHWKCYLHCHGVKLHVVTSTGEINVKKLAETFEYLHLQLAERCANIVEPDPCQKIYLLAKCVNEDIAKRFPL